MPPGPAQYSAQEVRDAVLRIWNDPIAYGEAVGYRGARNGRKRFGHLHRAILDHSNSHPRTSTVVPRGHAKSTLLSVVKNAHRLVRDPSARILIASAGQDLAKKLVGEVRQTLGRSIEILPGIVLPPQEVFPWAVPVLPSRSSDGPCDAFNITGREGMGREPSVFAASVGTNLAGNHPTHGTIDDPVNEQNSRTYARRQATIEFLYQLEPLMYDESSPLDHIGTPWAFSDATAYLRTVPDWHQYRFGVWDGVNPETGEQDGRGPGPNGAWPLCPSFMTAEEILDMQRKVSKQFFAAQLLCEPIPAEDALFDDNLVREATLGTAELPPGPDILLWDPIASLDAASPDRHGLVLVRATNVRSLVKAGLGEGRYDGMDRSEQNRTVFIAHYAEEIAGNAHDGIARIERAIAQDEWPNLKTIWVENVVFSGTFGPWLQDRGNLHGVTIHRQKIPRANLKARLHGVPVAMKGGYFLLARDFPGRQLLANRLCEFPLCDFDDLLAAIALTGTYLQRTTSLPGVNSPVNRRWDTDPGAEPPGAQDGPAWPS